MRLIAFLLLICTAFIPGVAHAQILVSNAIELHRAVEYSDIGAEIVISAGRYEITDLKLPNDISIRGLGEVIFYSSRPVAKGILNPLPGTSIRIENIKFLSAHSPDQNGAGIRHDGDDLTIIDCIFEDNENGILATGTKDGAISVNGSEFLRNGYGDGYSHGIYVVSAERLEIKNSQFIGTRIGHHVKSLARFTSIRRSTFDDADGRTSYAIDTSKGGIVEICENSFTQAANAENATLINYDLSRGGKPGSLTISNNHITNHHPYGKLLRNKAPLTAQLNDNEIINRGDGALDYPKGAVRAN